MSTTRSTLEKYLPEDSLDLIINLLSSDPIEFRISKPRKTKLGDYRFPQKGGRHKISVNSDLNPYAFLITLIHELAHLKAFKDFGKHIKAHGEEWQQVFRDLSSPFIDRGIFPDNIKEKLISSLNKGRASSCTDLELYRALKAYDEINSEPTLTVEMLEEGQNFVINGNKLFKKGIKLRKRYKCLNLKNGREYMVHPLAEVTLVESKITKSA